MQYLTIQQMGSAWVYLNNRFVPEAEAVVSPFDYGLLFGDGLFETLRAYGGTLFRLDAHLERFQQGAARLEIPLPSTGFLASILHQTLQRNDLRDALLRLTVTRGVGNPGLHPASCRSPTLIVTARPLPDPSSAPSSGLSAVVVNLRRNPPQALDPAIKSANFLNNVLAKLEADRRGADEGIFLNLDGALTEATTGNIFWLAGGRLKTPDLSAGLLNGITRQVVIALADAEGIQVEEGHYDAEDLYRADEAFVTSTGAEIAPLIRVDDRMIGCGAVGPTTQRLQQAFRQRVEAECFR